MITDDMTALRIGSMMVRSVRAIRMAVLWTGLRNYLSFDRAGSYI